MNSSISVRFAMDTWGIMFQSMVPGMTTSFLLAKEMGNLLRSSLMNQHLAVVKQVACSSANDRGLFNFYVKFDWAPDPMIAIKFLSLACLELNGLHFEVYDPLNYMAYVKLPFEQKEADLDNRIHYPLGPLVKRLSQILCEFVKDICVRCCDHS